MEPFQFPTKIGTHSFLIHPDYVNSDKALDVYKSLLEEINRQKAEYNIWLTLPGEVDRWWRDRSAMTLVPTGDGWTIEGAGSERARLAYACLDGNELTYKIGRRVN